MVRVLEALAKDANEAVPEHGLRGTQRRASMVGVRERDDRAQSRNVDRDLGDRTELAEELAHVLDREGVARSVLDDERGGRLLAGVWAVSGRGRAGTGRECALRGRVVVEAWAGCVCWSVGR